MVQKQYFFSFLFLMNNLWKRFFFEGDEEKRDELLLFTELEWYKRKDNIEERGLSYRAFAFTFAVC